MIKKTLILTIMLITFIIALNCNTFSFASNEIEDLKREAEKALEVEINNNDYEVNSYYNSLMQIKENLNQAILEKADNVEELQVLKYKINVRSVELEEAVRIHTLNSSTHEYKQANQILGASGAGNRTVLVSATGSAKSGKISFRGTASGINASLAIEPDLFCQQHGGSLSSVRKSNANVEDGEDATLYVESKDGQVTWDEYMPEIRSGLLSETKYEETVTDTVYARTPYALPWNGLAQSEVGMGFLSEHYYYAEKNSSTLDGGTTRTIAKFTSSRRQASAGEAYILSQAENNTGYPSDIQQAYWLYQEGKGQTSGGSGGTWGSSGYAEDADGAGESISAAAQQLAAEAIKMDEVSSATGGMDVQNTTNMEECSVAYNLDEHYWYAGPFTISYEREVLQVTGTSLIEQMQSQILENKVPGVIEYSGINNIKYYDENGKELQGVELVRQNKSGGQAGDEGYKFPYPDEEFYVKIPYQGNESSKELSKMEVEVFNMYSEGEVYDLTGTYELQKFHGVKIGLTCIAIGYCEAKEPGHTKSSRAHRWYCTTGCTLVDTGGYEDPETGEYIPALGYACPTGHECTGPFYCSVHTQTNIYEKKRAEYLDGHLRAWVHYIYALGKVGERNAQKLLNLIQAETGMEFESITVELEKELTMKMGGTVYNDLHTGKESDQNGIKDANEEGIKGVKVTITPKPGIIEGETKSTYTDENGKWSIEDVIVGQYDVEFEYDGQTYKTTKYLASGNIKDLNDSKAEEVESERQEFNNKFYEIAYNTAISTNGTRNALQYETSRGVSKIITREANTNIPLEIYKMRARTSSKNIYYPLDNLFNIDDSDENIEGKTYNAVYPYLENINLGLVKRAEADIGLTVDVFQSMTMINGNRNIYTWNEREYEKEDAVIDITQRDSDYFDYEYEQEINKDDYNFNPNSPDALEVYVDYKIMIRNQSQIASVYISELASYYDGEYLTFVNSNKLTQSASYIVDRENMINNPVNWGTQSQYNPGTNTSGYKSVYTTGIKDIVIEPGQTIEVHIMFQVAKDQQKKIIMDEGQLGKKNTVEISAYRTYLNGKIEGRIDRDSNPGNVNLNQQSTFEDDTDSASLFKLVFQKNANKGNVILGSVWEDIKEEGLFDEQGINIGNWEYEFGKDKLVNDVLVELYRVNLDKTEDKISEMRTGTNGLPDGNYEFTNLATGQYKVKFTYGDEYQLTYDLKYNGQDYQAKNRKP